MSANMDAPSLGQALATLREAMRARGGGTTDPDRRRAAATLSELLRSDEDELERFAARHLPGRSVEPDTIKALQDLVLVVARLVAMHGCDGDRQRQASALSASVRATLVAGLEALERAPPGPAPAEQPGPITAGAPPVPPPRAVAVPTPPAGEHPRPYEIPSYALAALTPGVQAPTGTPARAPEAALPAAPLAVPWRAGAEHDAAPGAELAPPRASQVLPDASDEHERMNGTVCDDEPKIGPILPFQAAPAGVRPPSPVPAPRAKKPGAHLASTAPLSRAVTGAVLPFQAARAPAQALPMPVERYAAFLAELSRDYARAPAIRARYGIVDEAAQRELGAAFASAFERNPSLRVTFEELLRRMRQGG